MSYKAIIFEEEDDVATIILNRPAIFNALDSEMGEELVDAIEKCKRRARIKVLIITGAGKAFCSGGDLKAMKEWSGDLGDFFLQLTKFLHRVILDIRMMPKPVIASINGPAAGAGFSLALACDLRIASDKATFRQAYTSVALVPDGGWTFHLPKLIGLGKASELIFLDKTLTTGEAEELGLISQVVPEAKLKEATLGVAKRLAKGPSLAFARAKDLLNRALTFSLESQLESERQQLALCGETEDFREALTAFFEKREPKFQGK
ncbi:MAG TPA: enoyl-CoA hydratase [Candidatus Bathyarchaeia archaeon]|nr:enoyl-CoA hydratase [Candidatus Bathyarchaeia archaeon]